MTLGAEALRRRFAVQGRFQERTLDGCAWPMRSHLEIFDPLLPWPGVADAAADLVAVMMNPGGSRPLAPADAAGWAPTLPDRTQYQLMKLALHAQFLGLPIRHIRVINLSDLRFAKSAALFAALGQLRDDRHSIFSPRRADELARALGQGPGRPPVLRAWGMATQLQPLVRQALPALASSTELGLTDDGWRYRHPLPQRADLQQQWLTAMAVQLEGLTRPALPTAIVAGASQNGGIVAGSPRRGARVAKGGRL